MPMDCLIPFSFYRFVETMRYMDFISPESQAKEGSFFGLEPAFEGLGIRIDAPDIDITDYCLICVVPCYKKIGWRQGWHFCASICDAHRSYLQSGSPPLKSMAYNYCSDTLFHIINKRDREMKSCNVSVVIVIEI
ncbi:Photosystem I chlorophyll a/b-binding protein 5 [Nymphaea thermarum]|nr:Photosystem I chlorophyll a/b-binding protein 5 [Nymphaea thermarum]